MAPVDLELVKLAINAGTFGLNALIVYLLYKLVDKWADKLVTALTAALQAFGSLSAKIDSRSEPTRDERKDPK